MTTTMLITGTSSGFGRLAAEQFARNGLTVFATMREPDGRNQAAATALRDLARHERLNLSVLDLDMSDERAIEQVASTVLNHAGQLDVLLNNAAYGAYGWSEGYTTAQIRELFEVNLFGVMALNRAVLPAMRRQRDGIIIHVSSVFGRVPWRFMSAYVASKYALEGYAESLNLELEPFGIQSVLVEPGLYNTAFGQNIVAPSDTTRLADYGELADAPQHALGSVVVMVTAPDAQQPAEVIDGIARLIDTPKHKRPLRTVIDRTIFRPLVEGLNAESLGASNELAARVAGTVAHHTSDRESHTSG